jgi:hypothetical protein
MASNNAGMTPEALYKFDTEIACQFPGELARPVLGVDAEQYIGTTIMLSGLIDQLSIETPEEGEL